ncbi:MAG: IS701 family transposase [Saprospiraceae bacterium]
MTQVLSDKKKLHFNSCCTADYKESYLSFIQDWKNCFKVYRRDNLEVAKSYILGLMKCEKNHTNIERMVEQIPEKAYHQYHNFLSESKWDHTAVNNQTALKTSALMGECKAKSKKPTGYIIDESSHLKKGKESVGVARQYAGVSGKVDNCQVAVYGSLCNDGNTTIIDTRLFLPQKWVDDTERCDKACIPIEERVFQTKPQKALQMIKSAIELGVDFDWIGGDGLYGHNTELTHALDTENLFYVLDVHKSETIYLEEPSFSVPKKTSKRGATPTKIKANKQGFRIDEYCKKLEEKDWKKVRVRKTTKGWKFVNVHTVNIWHWDGIENMARTRTLVITATLEKKPKIKYSFSNGTLEEYTCEEYAYFQCSRYWVERCFDDAKNELGLSGYQVRKWIGWHHHQSLVMMASLFLLNIRKEQKPEYELMSLRDARIITIAHMFSDQNTIEKLYEQMAQRHKVRKRDIDRFYKKTEDEFKV